LREFDAADSPGLLIVFPARSREIAADDAFDWKHFSSFDKHAATFELGCVGLELRWVISDIGGDEMVFYGVAKEVEPEERDLRENAALVRDSAAEDVVEGGDTVGSDEEEMLVR
jgi:hypothetical protein